MADKIFLDIKDIDKYTEYRFDELIVGFLYEFVIFDFFHPEERTVSKGDSRSNSMSYYIYECMLDTAPVGSAIDKLADIKTGFPVHVRIKQNFSVNAIRNALGRYFAENYQDKPAIMAQSGTIATITMQCLRSTKKQFKITKLKVYER